MKKLIVVVAGLTLALAGCSPQLSSEKTVDNDSSSNTKKEAQIVTKNNISSDYYRTLLPYKESPTRGLIVSNLNTRYDINEMEVGLQRIATGMYNTDDFVFQEGQYLKKETVVSWLNRKYSDKQLKEKKLSDSDNVGLNPEFNGNGTDRNPIYLAHILEQNYLENKGDTVNLSGVTIGLAMNSVDYYQKESYGATYTTPITTEKMKAEGEKMAATIITRMRQMKGLSEVPITVAIFGQNAKDAMVSGNYIASATAKAGSSELDKWNSTDEKYVLFPSDDAKTNYLDDYNWFKSFSGDIQTYFSNYNGVIGRGFYQGKEMKRVTIDIPVNFFGEAEIIGFTQFAADMVAKHVPSSVDVEVNIKTTDSQANAALITRDSGSKKAEVHIFDR
ncbi:CamS family sex pheromone protein [Brochothrix campestris]|uniref:CamS family sex pheromone protein n=1 Tax=Brochothrix campestris TaxID=2757 RepID=UPI0038CFF686